ncbi:MAG: CdaR family protein [Heliobacteriaceae bacterium]|nr:CdaR family protein [Heliobacteriaceae bacterium]
MKGFTDVARRNWVYKLAAFILAVMLWLYVQAEQQGVRVLSVPLDAEGLEMGYVVEPDLPKVIEVRVKGPKGTMANLSSRDFRARVDFNGLVPGPVTVKVQVDAPPAVEVMALNPVELALVIDVLENRSLPVSYEFKGTSPPGYRVGDPVLEPKAVVISGPRERVRSIQKVVVQIPLGAKETIVQSLPVRVASPVLKAGEEESLRISPKSVEVTVPITAEPPKTVPVQAQVTGTPAKGFRVGGTVVEPAGVFISGPAEQVQAVGVVLTEPVDVSGLSSDVTREVSLVVPAGVQVQGATKVRVTIKIVPSEEKEPGQGEVKPVDGQEEGNPEKDKKAGNKQV